MEWKYDKGDEVLFTCTDSDWKKVGPVRCKIVRRLTDMEADLCETGPMYEVMFLDMVLDTLTGPIETYHAFGDELTPIEVDDTSATLICPACKAVNTTRKAKLASFDATEVVLEMSCYQCGTVWHRYYRFEQEEF